MDELSAQLVGPLTENGFGDRYFFNLSRYTFDKISAFEQFERRFAQELFEPNRLNIIIGTDSGLLVSYVQAKALPVGSRFIFIEPASVLKAIQVQELLPDLGERIVCISLEDWNTAVSKFKLSDYLYINAASSFTAICAQDDYIDEYAELSWTVVEMLTQLHWRHSVALGQEAFIAMQLNNVADNRYPAKCLANAFSGKTAMLLAGGPSLIAALPWVKEHRNHLIVLAVSRISRQLVAAGIEPDFVFSVDPYGVSFDVSKEMFNFGERTTFICSYHAVPTLINQWPGKMLYLGGRLPWQSELNVPNFVGVGPTVTNTAFNAARDFGIKRVILAGVDLCYTREGFTHAEGSNEQMAGPKLNLTSLQVETNGGYLAPTGLDYAQAIETFAAQTCLLQASGCKVINVSEGAAKIKGVDYVPLADICLDETSVDAAAVVKNKIDGLPNHLQDFDALLKELKYARFQVKAIRDLAAEARGLNQAMYSDLGTIENYKDKRRLDQIEKKFKREYRRFAKLVKQFGMRRFIQVTKPFDDSDWSPEEAKRLGNIYYDAYQDGADRLTRLIDVAIDQVLARQQEYRGNPDFDVLLAQAYKEKSFGRVRIWQKLFVNIQLPQRVREEFLNFERRFVEIINESKTKHLAIMNSARSLEPLKHRATLLFKHKKSEQLANLLLSLDKHEDKKQGTIYQYLVSGYLAELEGDPAKALDCYHQIIDNADGLLEQALIRVAAISIDNEDINNASLALKCLSQLNPIYLPIYANCKNLQGDFLAAIDAYAAYINQFPKEPSEQMKLAMLYLDNNLFDGAEMMLDYILQNHPQMETAMLLKQRLLQIKPNSH